MNSFELTQAFDSLFSVAWFSVARSALARCPCAVGPCAVGRCAGGYWRVLLSANAFTPSRAPRACVRRVVQRSAAARRATRGAMDRDDARGRPGGGAERSCDV